MDPKRLVRVGYDRLAYTYRAEASGACGHDYPQWVDKRYNGLGPRPHILDLGCGCGVPVARLLASRGEVTGVDISPVQVDRARALVPGGRFICDDMCSVQFLEYIISVTAAAHIAARRVMEKAGLTYQGTRYWMNPEVPVVWYAIDRLTWRARNP